MQAVGAGTHESWAPFCVRDTDLLHLAVIMITVLPRYGGGHGEGSRQACFLEGKPILGTFGPSASRPGRTVGMTPAAVLITRHSE